MPYIMLKVKKEKIKMEIRKEKFSIFFKVVIFDTDNPDRQACEIFTRNFTLEAEADAFINKFKNLTFKV